MHAELQMMVIRRVVHPTSVHVVSSLGAVESAHMLHRYPSSTIDQLT